MGEILESVGMVVDGRDDFIGNESAGNLIPLWIVRSALYDRTTR